MTEAPCEADDTKGGIPLIVAVDVAGLSFFRWRSSRALLHFAHRRRVGVGAYLHVRASLRARGSARCAQPAGEARCRTRNDPRRNWASSRFPCSADSCRWSPVSATLGFVSHSRGNLVAHGLDPTSARARRRQLARTPPRTRDLGSDNALLHRSGIRDHD
jgi:hypothetical protein